MPNSESVKSEHIDEAASLDRVSIPASAASWASELGEQSRSLGKLAPQLAKRVEMEIFRLGWPVGHALGKEEELASRFGVSRAVMREALAITERDGITRRRRGRNGGVVVAAPAREVVSSSLGNYFSIAGLSGEQLIDSFSFVNNAVHRLAIARCGESDVQNARALLAIEQPQTADSAWQHIVELHECLLKMSRNQVLQILGTAVLYVGVERLYARIERNSYDNMLTFVLAVVGHQRAQIESVIAADTVGAARAEQTLIELWRAHYLPLAASAHPAQHSLDADEALDIATRVGAIFYPNREIKRAETLAAQLHREIQNGGLKAGDRLDNEATLLQRYQVGRGVLREAIRYLERSSVVRMEEGRKGGLRVAAPEPGDAVRSAILHFRFLELSPNDMLELGLDLEMAAISAAANNARRHGISVLGSFATAVRAAPDSATDLQSHLSRIYLGLSAASGNPFFIAVMQIFFTFLTVEPERRAKRKQQDDDLLHSAAYADYLAQMDAVVTALENADAALARRRLLLARRTIDHGLQPHSREMGQMMDLI